MDWRHRTVCLAISLILLCLAACGGTETAVPTLPFATNPPLQQPVSSASATNHFYFNHLGLEDGLSQSSIYGIVQDRRGFLWFATEDGLNRYDGYGFQVYKPDPDDPNSLADGFIQTLVIDRDGCLWIGTNNGGLDRFDPQTAQFTHFTHDPDNPNSLSSNDVLSIFQDQAGAFWIGTHGAGLNKLTFITNEDGEESAQFSHYPHAAGDKNSLSHDVVQAVLRDAEGAVWIGTHDGLDRLDPDSGTVEMFRHDPANPNSLSHNQVHAIYEDRGGVLWIGTDWGLNRYLGNGRFHSYLHDPADPTSLSDNQVRVISEDRAGRLWIGTEGGLNHFNRQTGEFIRYKHDPANPQGLGHDNILSLYEDKSGVFWVGFAGGGLSLAEPGRRRFTLYRHTVGNPASLSQNVVLGMDEDANQTIWLGTLGGLNRFDPTTETFTAYPHNPENLNSLVNNNIWDVEVDKAGMVWVGTEGGLDRYDPTAEQFTHFHHDPEDPNSLIHNHIWTLFEDRSGTLWIGTEAGLDRFEPSSQRFSHYRRDPDDPNSLSGQAVVAIFQDSQNTIWVGTFDGGLNSLDAATGQFTHFQHDPADPASLSHNAVTTFYEDKNGRLWLGTYGGGLNVFDPQTETFDHYREADGLPSDAVYAIIEDDQGFYWLSTNQGVARFDPRTETFRNFNVADGLQSNEFDLNASLQSSSGDIYLGGVNGLNRFNPAEISFNTYLPPVTLSALTVDGRPLPAEQTAADLSEVALKWPQNGFEFEMAALSFDRSEKNQYAYLLEGFDAEWIFAGTNRFGRYTNLPGGAYTLHLAAANADGSWSASSQPVAIKVQPPWWNMWPFRVSAFLLLVGLFVGAYQLRIRNMHVRSEELAAQVSERTQELTALYTITAVVSSSLDLDKTLSAALDKTLDLMTCNAGAIHLLGMNGNGLQLTHHQGLSQQCLDKINHLSTTDPLLEAILGAGKPQIIYELVEHQSAIPAALSRYEYIWSAVTPLIAHGIVLGTLLLASRRPRYFSKRDIELLGSIGNQIGVAVENARLFEAEHLRADQFQLINQVSRRFTSTLEIDEVLRQVVELIQQTFGYYHVAIGLVEGSEVVYQMGAGALWDNPAFDFYPARLKIGIEGVTGWVAASGKPLLAPDVTQEPRYVWMHASKARSELAVPVFAKEKVIGVLDLQSDKLDDFDETDLVVMQALASQAGIAIENARLYEQAQQLAVMEERNRLARDLHDSVTQSIYSLTLLAEAGQRMIQAGDAVQIGQNQTRLGAIAQQALQEMRLLVYELRPLDLREAGLAAALEQRLEVVERRAGVEARLSVHGNLDLAEEVEEALYRIAHEALNNALKHAGATAVSVTLQCKNQTCCLEISDNGRGFEPDLARRQGGLGLVSMRERVEELNGRFQIQSSPGHGATIYAEIPQTTPSPDYATT